VVVSEEIPEEVKQFVFEYIDSVELLEVLLFLRSHSDREWSSNQISKELRSSSASVIHRLHFLKSLNLIEERSPDVFTYATHNFETLITSLAESYKIRPHAIQQIIFSPMKKAKQFANAFMLSNPKKGEPNG
jgi:hypothetical protein